MSNFLFLKKNNENLFKIISEAEKLFRDEYFEQVMVQTRRFGENVCRDLLEERVSLDDSFDSIINRLKDKSYGNTRMQEFTEDLFFLKKHGNSSAHSSRTNSDGKIALECLERAFEVSVFYSNAKYGYSKKIDKSVFSEELLMTGKQTKTTSLKEKYTTKLKDTREDSLDKKIKKASKPKQKPIKYSKSKGKTFESDFDDIKGIAVFLVVITALVYLYLNIN